MTSDQGNASEETPQVSLSSPVTLKTPPTTSLNPNANVFHSSKTPSTPPTAVGLCGELDNTPGAQPGDQQLDTCNDGFSYMNGESEVFPPTPETPETSPVEAAPPPETDSVEFPEADDTGGGEGEATAVVLEAQELFPEPPSVVTTVVVDQQEEDGGATEMQPPASSMVSPTSPDETVPLEGSIPDEDLRGRLRNQLEYYFSLENLANDTYLVSQMDADRFVLISTVAGFRQVKRLTHNLELVVEVLRESSNVQVDEKGEKVRPLHKRCIVILREIPEETPKEEVENLFRSENCPPFASCEFAHNDNWYVTFETEKQAQDAYSYLREEVRSFLGKPIMARIKAKPLVRNSYSMKNGFKSGTAQPAPVAAAAAAAVTPGFEQNTGVAAPMYSSAPVPQALHTHTTVVSSATPFPAPVVTASMPVTYTQSLPFFPPTQPLNNIWPPPNHVAYYDPGTVFAANGYTPTATFRLTTQSSNQQQHSFHNMRPQSQRHESRSKPNRFQQQQQHALPSPSSSHHGHTMSSSHEHSHHHSHHHHNNHHPHHHRHHYDHQQPPRSSAGMRAPRHRAMEQQKSAAAASATSQASSTASAAAVSSSAVPAVSSQQPPVAAATVTVGAQSAQQQQESNGYSRLTAAADTTKDNATSMQQPGPQRSSRSFRGRRKRGNDEDGAKRGSGGNAQQTNKESAPQVKPPPPPPPREAFELEDTSFPPLPGASSNSSTSDVFENKMSDVVKGKAKPLTKTTAASPSSQSTSVSTTAANGAGVSGVPALSTTEKTMSTISSAAALSSSVTVASSTSCTTSGTTAAVTLPTPPQSPPNKGGKSLSPELPNNKQQQLQTEKTSSESKLKGNRSKSPAQKQDDNSSAVKTTSAENGPPKMSYALIVAKAKAKPETDSVDNNKKGSDNEVSNDIESSKNTEQQSQQENNHSPTRKRENGGGRGGRGGGRGSKSMRNGPFRGGSARTPHREFVAPAAASAARK